MGCFPSEKKTHLLSDNFDTNSRELSELGILPRSNRKVG